MSPIPSAVRQYTLMHDSHYTHRWMLTQPHRLFRPVDWVEVMMPFYRGDLFLAAREHMVGNVSSWGLDKYLWPTLQQLRGQTRTALIDAVTASHRNAMRSKPSPFSSNSAACLKRKPAWRAPPTTSRC